MLNTLKLWWKRLLQKYDLALPDDYEVLTYTLSPIKGGYYLCHSCLEPAIFFRYNTFT